MALVLLAALMAGCSGGAMSSGGGGQSSSSSSSSPTGGPYPPPATPTDHVTFQHDTGRTGLYPTESLLTLTNVNSSSFGLLRTLPVDGKVDAQPLYLSQLTVAGSPHNVVFAVTENDSVYAFDVDSAAVLWKMPLLPSGETPSDDRGCDQVIPTIGVSGTPVIDRKAGAHGEIFLVAMSKDGAGAYHQRLHALDVTTGAEATGSPVSVSATYALAGGVSKSFDPGQYEERAALLLSGGTIYTSWTSHCDDAPYNGWVIAYSESTLGQTGVLNVAASSDSGPSIWMAGNGPAVDAGGNLYLLTANGTFDTTLDVNGFPSAGDYGNSILKISTTGGHLAVADYFSSSNTVTLSNGDVDLGSGGEVVLPDVTDGNGTVRHLVVGAGKEGVIYLADRDQMGKFNALTNNIWQAIDGLLSGAVFSSPAYFNGTLYYCDAGGTCKALPLVKAKLTTASSFSTVLFPYPGATPAISANGTASAILWAHENSNPAVLHAFDAGNLATELYNSSQAAGGRDQFGAGNKFIAPAVADGRVLVGTTNSVAVFGLLSH
jgi:hypothetical protein